MKICSRSWRKEWAYPQKYLGTLGFWNSLQKIEDLYKDLLKIERDRVEEFTNINKALQSLIEGIKK